jgi:uncharacterized protein (TIRG00374 family)
VEGTKAHIQAPPATEKRTKTVQKRLVLTAVKVLVSVALIYWILRSTNLVEIFDALRSASIPLLVLAASLHLVGYTVSALRWRELLRAQGNDTSIPFLIQSYMVSIFFNNFLPSIIGGDTVRAYDSWRVGQSKADAVAVIFVDRFLGMLSLMLFAASTLLFSNKLAASLSFLYLLLPLMVAGMLIVVGIIFMPPQKLAAFILRTRLPVFQKLQNTIVEAFQVFRGQKGVLVRALGLSLLLQANVVFHYYLIGRALDLSVPLSSFFLIIPLAIFLMMFPVSVNAIGVRENVFAFFFATFGVLNSEAVAFAWLAYGIVVLQGVLGGVIYALRR